MKRYAKKALVTWIALELIGALFVAAGGKTLLAKLQASMQPKPPAYASLGSSR